MMVLPGRQRSLTISSVVWIQCTNVTDRRSDRQTDTGRQQRPRLRIAPRDKNLCFLIFKWFMALISFSFAYCSRVSKILVPICTKFGQLILRKIIKIIATRCQILRPKCTKFVFGWGSAPDPAEELTVIPQTPLAGFKGPYF